MKFIIRKAEEKDLNSIAELYRKKDDFPMSPPGKEKRNIFSEMLRDESKHILVGEKNGIITAFISMRIESRLENHFKLSAFITDIKTDFHHAEILTAILSRATAIAMEKGCSEIILFDNCIKPEFNSVYSICNFRQNNTVYHKKL